MNLIGHWLLPLTMYFEWVKEGFWKMSKNQILSHPMRDSGTVMESTMS